MNKEVLDYLSGARVGVLAVALPDGTPHGATVHFACSEEPFTVLIGTGEGTMKGKAIKEAGSLQATFVVGFSEEEMCTFQADGEVSVAGDSQQFDDAYLGKLPEKAERMASAMRIVFTPKWWRYSDMKNKIFLSSQDPE